MFPEVSVEFGGTWSLCIPIAYILQRGLRFQVNHQHMGAFFPRILLVCGWREWPIRQGSFSAWGQAKRIGKHGRWMPISILHREQLGDPRVYFVSPRFLAMCFHLGYLTEFTCLTEPAAMHAIAHPVRLQLGRPRLLGQCHLAEERHNQTGRARARLSFRLVQSEKSRKEGEIFCFLLVGLEGVARSSLGHEKHVQSTLSLAWRFP